jgi:uncharacterized protein
MAVSSRRGGSVPGALEQRLTDTIVRVLVEEYPELEAVYVYGSAAGEAPGRDSDFDIAVLLPGPTARNTGVLAMSDAKFRLQGALGRRVDLVNARTVPIVLQKEIVASGICVHAPARSLVEEYEMLVLSKYGKLNEERREILAEFRKTRRAYSV